jgi:hypothetical protein
MKTTIILKGCAKDLREIRAQLPNNLEPCVIELFESVVRRLEKCEMVAGDRAALTALIDDGLRLVGRIAEAAVAIAELISHLLP